MRVIRFKPRRNKMALEEDVMPNISKHGDVRYRKWKGPSKENHEVVDQDQEKYQILAKHRYTERRQQYEGSGLLLPSTMTFQSYDNLNVVDVYHLLQLSHDRRPSKQASFIQKIMGSRLLHSMPLLKLIKGNTPTNVNGTRQNLLKSSDKGRRDASQSGGREISQAPLKQDKPTTTTFPSQSDSTPEAGPNKNGSSIKVLDISRKYHECTSSATAGLDLLYDKIGSGVRILHDIQAGNSLLSTIQRERHRKEILDMLRRRNILKTGREGMDYRSSLVLTPKIFTTTTTRLCQVDNLPECMLPPKQPERKEMTLPPATTPLIVNEPSKARIKINFFAKMKSICSILCFLHNVIEEDLVSNEPMPYPQIKLLCKKLQITVRTNRPYVKRLQDYMHFQRKQDGRIGDSSGCRLKWSPSCEVLPTPWDLLEHEESTPPRSLPAWKRKLIILQPEKESAEPQDEKWSSNKKSLCIFRNEIAAKLKAVLRQHEQVQLRAWSLKSKYLSYGPVMEKQLKKMRKTSYHVRWEEGESIIPEWFTLLIEEMNTIFENEVVSEKHNQALQELQQFLYMKTRNIPFVVEKVSLFVMSLPAYYLGIREVHLALELVCKHIVMCSPVLISTLKMIRKLPTTIELRPPKYLFGHLIYTEDY